MKRTGRNLGGGGILSGLSFGGEGTIVDVGGIVAVLRYFGGAAQFAAFARRAAAAAHPRAQLVAESPSEPLRHDVVQDRIDRAVDVEENPCHQQFEFNVLSSFY